CSSPSRLRTTYALYTETIGILDRTHTTPVMFSSSRLGPLPPIFTINAVDISAFKNTLLYLLALVHISLPGHICSQRTLDELLSEGNKLLAARQFNDALALYIEAVERHPKSHLLYYSRGATYVALGKPRLALTDFDESLNLKPDFSPAIEQRGNLHLKTGNLDKAKADFSALHSVKNSVASEKLMQISALEKKFSEAQYLYKSGHYREVLPILNSLIDVMWLNSELLEMRGNALLEVGQVQQGFDDLRRGVHLVNDNRAGLLRLAQLLYRFGHAVESRKEIYECLKLDPDDSGCLKHYKVVNKLSKSITNAQEAFQNQLYDSCISHAKDILRLEPSNQDYQSQAKVLLCSCLARSHSEGGVSYCEEVTQQFPHNVELQCDLAEAYINAEKYDDAIGVCDKILHEDRNNQRADDLRKKARKLKEQSLRVNYYEVLGVPRKATKQQIRIRAQTR
ncbi:unnamed protein product, partial [Dicrocoelium dendriticum]